MSLRHRVLRYMALAAVASCALTVGIAAVLVRHRISTQKLHQISAQANVLALVGGAPGALRAGDHVYRVGVHRPRQTRPATTARVLAAVPAGNGQGTIAADGRTLLYAARTTANGRIIIVGGAGLRFAEWSPFLLSLGLAGLGGFLLAALLSLILARRLTRPIGELAHATGRLAAGEQGVMVAVGGNDELAGLGRSFNLMSTELTRARAGQRTFLESVSHELKTPLTSVRGYAEALQDGAIGAAEGGRVIAGEAGRLERLVSDLLELARVGREGFAVNRGPVDLAAVGEAALTRSLVRARELGVSLSGEAVGAASGLGDEGRLVQATSNLIENALRLSPAGGIVTVRSAGSEIVVCDSGPGLAHEDLGRAFERFYLHDRYRSDPERAVGSGLGLAIVAELVTAMGGSVTAENRPTAGACFTIRLAAAPAPPVSSGA